MTAASDFRAARDLLLELRTDYDAARSRFRWPQPERFNWAIDWLDHVAHDRGQRPALIVAEERGTHKTVTFAEMADRSNEVAAWWQHLGVGRGDRILFVMANSVALWECFLAAMKLGAVVVPASPLLSRGELADRIGRGRVRHIVSDLTSTKPLEGLGTVTRLVTTEAGAPTPPGWLPYAARHEAPAKSGALPFTPADTAAADALLMFFTSGTTALPKLVRHTHGGYPIGHLSTMYWVGMQPGDVHLNLASPGWAKHAGGGLFGAWNAEATVVVYNYERFSAPRLLDVMARSKVTTFCAPPTAWRLLVQEDLRQWSIPLREVVSAGEPLNPEIIDRVKRAWGITLRDGYGQTETTHLIGNTPGQRVKPGSMGRPLPGFDIVLLDPSTGEPAREGEISIVPSTDQQGLMIGYGDNRDDPAAGLHRTGDLARRDDDGYLTYIGRFDDVFKSSDYRISPFELESVLLEHPAVADVAVVASPDALRLSVPKAYVVLAAGWAPDRATALAIILHARDNLAPFKRIRRLEFSALPKTMSGKIRRTELRAREIALHPTEAEPSRTNAEWWDVDFSELHQ